MSSDLRERVRERVETIAAVAEELSGRRFHATSDQGRVVAEVDHRGRVVGIRFVDTVLTRVRGGELAAAVVAAVTAAQAEASAAVGELLLDRLGAPERSR
jgi:hypothetical protein